MSLNMTYNIHLEQGVSRTSLPGILLSMLMKLSSNIPRYFFIYARLSVICKSYLLFHSVTKFALMSSYLSDASINDDKVVSKENDINQLTEPISRPDNGLLIYWHPDCYLHEIPDHPVIICMVSFQCKYHGVYFIGATR